MLLRSRVGARLKDHTIISSSYREPEPPRQTVARNNHYVPAIDRFLVKVLYHEARHRKMPMTKLLALLLRDALRTGEGWRLAEQEIADTERHEAADQAA